MKIYRRRGLVFHFLSEQLRQFSDGLVDKVNIERHARKIAQDLKDGKLINDSGEDIKSNKKLIKHNDKLASVAELVLYLQKTYANYSLE
jgi:hypothetical protein